MQNDGSNLKRRMVPRWRPLAQTPAHELKSSGNGSKNAAIGPALKSANKRWEVSNSLVQAVELLDIAVVANDRKIAVAAAQSIIDQPTTARPSVVNAAHLYLGGDKTDTFQVDFENGLPAEPTRDRIRLAKRRMIDGPRDGLTATELSRLYALAGQRRKAQDWMGRALKLLPDNRYVLRSATRLFTHLNEPERAMDAISRSEAVRHDPWIQAAEVAVADQLEKSPRWAGKARKALSDGRVGISHSELAMGLASLEWKSGAKLRTVRKLVSTSLASPTESAVAQALWMRDSENISLEISSHYPMAMANEAAALRAREAGEYQEAIYQAETWALDQPFSPRPFMLASTAADIFLNKPDLSEMYCRRGRLYHPGNPSLLNGLIVSLAHQRKISEAEALMPDLYNTIYANVEMESYYHAAKGLIDFGRGRLEDGRAQYMQAITSAKTNNLNSLATNAILYWIEQEAMAQSFSIDEWSSVKMAIDKNISKLSGASKISAERVWQARSRLVTETLERHSASSRRSLMIDNRGSKIKFRLDRNTIEQLTT